MSRTLILLGLVLTAIGIFWPWLGWLQLGHLPGDIAIQRRNFSFYFPLTTGLLLSAVLSALFWLIKR